MSSLPEKESAALIKAYNQLVRFFRDIWIVLRVFSFLIPPTNNNLEKAKQNIKLLQKKVVDCEKAIKNNTYMGVKENLQAIYTQLKVIREILGEVEKQTKSVDFRRYFLKQHDNREEELIALIRFYKQSQPLSDTALDKADLLITELASNRVGFRRTLKPPFEIEQMLERIFDKPVPVNEYEDAVINEFKTATEQVNSAKDIEGIITKEIISTMRSFKKEIAGIFMNPRILPAVIRYNIVLNNKLVSIFEHEDGEIMRAEQAVAKIKNELGKLKPSQEKSIDGIIEKIKEIQDTYSKKKSSTSYDITLIVEAAKKRKAIQDSINKLKEIKEEEIREEQTGFKRKSVQDYINDIFHGLLQLESAVNTNESVKIPDLNIDLKKMDPWEKSLFQMDIQALGDKRRIYEALREAVVLRSKITEEYKIAKCYLSREQVESILMENLEMAEILDKELQSYLDSYNKYTAGYKAIDLLKVKSGLTKSINRLKSLAKMEGFKVER